MGLVDGLARAAVMYKKRHEETLYKERKQSAFIKIPYWQARFLEGICFKYYTCWMNRITIGGLSGRPRTSSCNDTRKDMRSIVQSKKTVSFYKDPILTSKIQEICFKNYTCWINRLKIGGLSGRPHTSSCNDIRRDMSRHCTKKENSQLL